MPKKSVFAILAAALMALCLFSGCRWDQEDSPMPEESSSSSVSSRPEKPASSGSSVQNPQSGLPDSVSSGDVTPERPASSSGAQSERPAAPSQSSASESGAVGAAFSSFAAKVRAAQALPETDAWMVRLVNASHPLPEDFTVETAQITGYDSRPFDKRAAPALEKMLSDAERDGKKLYLVSGYRSVQRQAALFKRKTEFYRKSGLSLPEAEAEAARWVARPGTSEHSTGLAADLVSADWYTHHDDLTDEFETTPEFVWLWQHCAEYGFILRYPRGREDVTGVAYEPWHYRWVGEKAAQEICRAGETLEEYTARHAPAAG